MPVISASICDKNGRILLARQFVPITKLKLEEYMANFPKLIDQSHGKQCTFIETDSIRYVYQPMEKLFLVLITSKGSNIIEDIEVIRQMQQVVVNQCKTQNVDEGAINRKAIDLILAFDDIISQGGYRESVTIPQIESYVDMDSTDEKLHRNQQKMKEAEMREEAKKQAREIARKRLDPNFKRDQMEAISSTDYENQPATSLSEMQGAKERQLGDTLNNIASDTRREQPQSSFQKMLQEQEMKGVAKKAPKKGLQLGKPKPKANQLLQDLEKQKVITKEAEQDVAGSNQVGEEKAPEYNPLTENVLLEVDERITCQLTKDGDIEKFELKGVLYLTLTDPKKCHAEVPMSFNDFKGLTFKVHPELDKQSWNKQRVLRGKNSGQEGAEGISAQTRLDALRYRYTSKTEEDLPFTINVFNSKKQGKNVITMEIEYNQNQDNLKFKSLENVSIAINMGDGLADVELLKQDVNVEKDAANNMLYWHVANIHEDESAVLSFASQGLSFEEMFPLEIKFQEPYSIIDLQMLVDSFPVDAVTGDQMSHKATTVLQADGYKVTHD